MVKALIFDFDGLILDTEYPEYLSWLGVYNDHGLDLPILTWASKVGGGWSTGMYDELERRVGKSIDREAVRAKRRAHVSEMLADAPLMPGVQELLQDCVAAGLQLGVASSSPREWVIGYLTKYRILEMFGAVRCGDEVNRTKPDPDLYLAVLDALQIRPSGAIALEDSAKGIAAAKAAGIYCVAVPNRVTIHTSLDAADAQVASLADISLDKFMLVS